VRLAGRHPLWSVDGLRLHYASRPRQPGQRRRGEPRRWDGSVDTVTIDATVAQLGLPRVDFVKMDIEGAELDWLMGDERIRQYRPKAISLYHKPEGFRDDPALAGRARPCIIYLMPHDL
jgi:hypothetical protein